MQDFRGKLAVVTGAATGMGRELAHELARAGCHLALCDVAVDVLAQTATTCRERGPEGLRVTSHRCDVSDEAQVIAFRDAVLAEHATDHVHLLFNNAGIGGGGSFVAGERQEWERTFGVCWFGVYYCTRAFLPLLVASDEAALINTSSVNGFWACLGPNMPHTAYSSAKFAVKGFTEALLIDLRVNAPHVKVTLVMPGHVGTDIGLNTRRLHGQPDPSQMDASEVAELRQRWKEMGAPVDSLSDDALRAAFDKRLRDFRDKAPMSALEAARVILDGVRAERWRVLVGEDAKRLDEAVRRDPEGAYERGFGARPGANR